MKWSVASTGPAPFLAPLGPAFVISGCDVHVTAGLLSLHWLARTHGNHTQPNLGRPPSESALGQEQARRLYVCPILSSQAPSGGKGEEGPSGHLWRGGHGTHRGCPCSLPWGSFMRHLFIQLPLVCQGPAVWGPCAGCWGYSSLWERPHEPVIIFKMQTSIATFQGW